MSREVEEANTTHVKWVLPIPAKENCVEVFGKFSFSLDSGGDFSRHIWIKELSMSNLFSIRISDLEKKCELGKVVSEYTQQGTLYSVMTEVQSDMNSQAVRFVERAQNAERAKRRIK